ncbi:formyltetrahydrofolate deformylase [Candidatus Aquiluna sp. UB-MaderosW2red]|uniref:formyltetrahydrofolate deformylase n=1 Tax=Candidatus Aquiluna sp. UB-MaderosW2red TaxID=1855377 RepID=UPI000875EA79|nr:formyltetrahydrofolate deformylase [Candidatus Aquiluna sp. UB-MaderosW2red]SCX07365.1 formyltetrahydrofolate deformylase [Candidatus Aquiluna sp. UB-MaderosW2red]
MQPTKEHWVLTFICADKKGIVHAISGVVAEVGGNITESQQYASMDTGRFFMRLQIEAEISKQDFEQQFEAIAERFQMEYVLDFVARPMRVLVLASKAGHCLNDLLYRQRSGQLPIEIPKVFANHNDLSGLATFYGVEFESMQIETSVDKASFEKKLSEFIHARDVELIVLARYMQILSPEFCKEFQGKIINIHHSFLPGFKGANPYAQAHARGVKIIGATAHFVTQELDEGPIVEQNVTRVEHSNTVAQLVSIGQDAESKTLTQAVKWFAEHRVLQDGARTVIFR